jgi:pSer/pThr/pTyr-binding forkhead associated (FHA) protein
MDVKLFIKKGATGSHEIPLTTVETLVGRQKGCKLRIPSGTVSRHHCRLLYEDDRLFVEDLNSSNGTFLNGARVQGKQLVQPGDEIEVGPVIFVANYLLVELGEPEIAAPAGETPLEIDGPGEAAVEVFAVEGPPPEEESPTQRKVIPAEDAPLALVQEDEEAVPPVLLDEELTLNTKGDEDLRDLLSKMQ